MNPFTRFLRTSRPTALTEFETLIHYWDSLESLVINIYRAGGVDADTEAAYQTLRAWLVDNYPRWADDLDPFWRQAKEAGAAPPSDPFVRLYQPLSAEAFINNRAAMQALPAARETINRYLLSKQTKL